MEMRSPRIPKTVLKKQNWGTYPTHFNIVLHSYSNGNNVALAYRSMDKIRVQKQMHTYTDNFLQRKQGNSMGKEQFSINGAGTTECPYGKKLKSDVMHKN